MHVALINMPIRIHAQPNNVPLGIYYVGQAIKTLVPDVAVIYVDLNAFRPVTARRVRQLLDAVVSECDVFMLSGLITTLHWQRLVSEYIRKKHPTAFIVSGGGLAIDVGSELLKWIPIDAICQGEGEGIVVELLADVNANSVQDRYSASIQRVLVEPPMNWEDVDQIETYLRNPIWGGDARNSSYVPFSMSRSLNQLATRGCPRSCRFCSRIFGQVFRMRKIPTVIQEVEYLAQKFCIDFMGFTDDNLAAVPDRLRELCAGLLSLQKRYSLHWGCHARFDEVDDRSLLKEMHNAGCVYIGFGGESANRDILKAMNKDNDPVQMVRVLQLCREEGIHPNATWMMGWPGETRAQVRETARFITKYAPENRSLFVATAYPRTSLFDEVKDRIYERYGTLKDYVLQLGDATSLVMNYSVMSDEEFSRVVELAHCGKLEKI